MILLLVASALIKSYESNEQAWRLSRETSLRRSDGWLSVAGLFWLKPGENTVGADAGSDVRLPAGAPSHYGWLVRDGHDVILRRNDTPAQPLHSDESGNPDVVKIGDVTFTVIVRGARVGVRLYDPHSKAQREFKGLSWFPIDKRAVVNATFVPYQTPRSLKITNVLGDVSDQPNPGYVEFKWHGKPCRLEAQGEGDGLFFNFQDATSGRETYGAGRFLYSGKPVDGRVTLDFNRATNPPCAYTAFATCPLPPAGNRLSVPVRAGEKAHHPAE